MPLFSKSSLGKFLVLAAIASPLAAHATTLDFGSLAGSNGDNFTTYTQDGFTVANSLGQFYVGKNYGNPIPNIYGGSLDGPFATSAVTVTDGGGVFQFQSVDLAEDFSSASYLFTGSLGGYTVFTEGGPLYTGASFATVYSGASGPLANIDSLTLQITGKDYNIDNIVLAPQPSSVPEPSSFILFGSGLLGLGAAIRRRLAA